MKLAVADTKEWLCNTVRQFSVQDSHMITLPSPLPIICQNDICQTNLVLFDKKTTQNTQKNNTIKKKTTDFFTTKWSNFKQEQMFRTFKVIILYVTTQYYSTIILWSLRMKNNFFF